jgi:hypothetical protein
MNDEQLTLDGRPVPAVVANRLVTRPVPLSSRQNPMIAIYGPGEPGDRCGACVSLVWKGGHGRRYFGCERRGKMTNGPATDHLARWASCALFSRALPGDR